MERYTKNTELSIPQDKRLVLTMEDLSKALREVRKFTVSSIYLFEVTLSGIFNLLFTYWKEKMFVMIKV